MMNLTSNLAATLEVKRLINFGIAAFAKNTQNEVPVLENSELVA